MHLARVVLALSIALAATTWPLHAAASDQGAILAVVHQYVDGFNESDAAVMDASCASPAVIIDDFPPHFWQGSGACHDWWNGYLAFAKQDAITNGHVTLGTPAHLSIDGDRAYVSMPATFALRDHEKPATEPATFTATLSKSGGTWRITGWAWADRQPPPPTPEQAAQAMNAVRRYFEGFNKADAAAMTAACAPPSGILEDFAPNVWRGTAACGDWWNDFLALGARDGFTHATVALSKPSYVDITGDRGYIVAPATFTYTNRHGVVKTEQPPAIVTVALRKTAGGWKIAGWAWANQTP